MPRRHVGVGRLVAAARAGAAGAGGATTAAAGARTASVGVGLSDVLAIRPYGDVAAVRPGRWCGCAFCMPVAPKLVRVAVGLRCGGRAFRMPVTPKLVRAAVERAGELQTPMHLQAHFLPRGCDVPIGISHGTEGPGQVHPSTCRQGRSGCAHSLDKRFSASGGAQSQGLNQRRRWHGVRRTQLGVRSRPPRGCTAVCPPSGQRLWLQRPGCGVQERHEQPRIGCEVDAARGGPSGCPKPRGGGRRSRCNSLSGRGDGAGLRSQAV